MSALVELALLCDAQRVEVAGDALMELGALSVAVEDADADTPDEQALFAEPGMPAPRRGWQRSVVKALFEDQPQAIEAVTLLLAQPFADGLHVQGLQPVEEQDWVRLTQAQFHPVAITPSFWIVPSWHAVPAEAAIALKLDPGLAFGTGTHPTTRMCLRWLAQHGPAAWASPGSRVLDYGCGSGILAISAGLLGATVIDAVDIDPAAVGATQDNAQANGVALSTGLPDLAQGAYALVVANILATPLKLLAPLLAAHLAERGRLLLAGLLTRQAEEMAAVYAPWLALQVADEEEGWVLLAGERRP